MGPGKAIDHVLDYYGLHVLRGLPYRSHIDVESLASVPTSRFMPADSFTPWRFIDRPAIPVTLDVAMGNGELKCAQENVLLHVKTLMG